jgi:hypothetical protein
MSQSLARPINATAAFDEPPKAAGRRNTFLEMDSRPVPFSNDSMQGIDRLHYQISIVGRHRRIIARQLKNIRLSKMQRIGERY